jgi:hypothetical protein
MVNHKNNADSIVDAYLAEHPELEWTVDNINYVYNTIAGHPNNFSTSSY